MFIVLFAGCNFSMEVWKQRALQQFESVYIVPVFQAALIVLAVLTGGVSTSAYDAAAAVLAMINWIPLNTTEHHLRMLFSGLFQGIQRNEAN